MGKLLSLKDACSYCGLNRKQLMKFVRNGSLRYVNVGMGDDLPRYYFNTNTLDHFMDDIETCM